MERKKAVLVVSFGTSYRETREKTLDATEREICAAFPGYEFRRAYTSPTIRRILRARDGILVDDPAGALERLAQEGFREVVVQTLHVIRGFEYDGLRAVVAQYRGRFDVLACGEPLLAEEADYREAVQVMGAALAPFRRAGRSIVLMGHGTEHAANESYARLQRAFDEAGFDDVLVGTVEASPTLDNMLELVRTQQCGSVVLTPFMMVAGDHACNDMAGDGEDSWKSKFLRGGCQVECVMKGLGEYEGIRRMYVRHAKTAAAGKPAGTLYGIGVGPGDPELLTLKAARILRGCEVVAAPSEHVEDSVAYQIALAAVPELAAKEHLGAAMPMTRDAAARRAAHERAADLVCGLLGQGKDVAFVNLGDVTVYASYLYVHRLVQARGFQAELVSGVPSFCAAAARLGIGLGEDADQIHILSQPEQIEEGLKLPGTKVIMKMGKNLAHVKALIREQGLDACLVERCGMEGERVCALADETDAGAGYYSLLIVKERR